MLRKIEALRKKSPEVRNRYAFWIALGVTSVIAVFWVVSMSTQFEVLTGKSMESKKTEGSISRTFSNMKAFVSNGLDQVPDVKELYVESEEESQTTSSTSIDFNTFFQASTTKPSSTESVTKKREKRVLIGTTSPSENLPTGE